jgi:copper ion binding protein
MSDIEIIVAGMTCQHCVNAVTEEVSALDGVSAVEVDLESGRVVISSHTPLIHSDLQAAIAEAGYEIESLS